MDRQRSSNMSSQMSVSVARQHLLTVEKLRARVHQILKCVINLHIEILVLESNVNQLLDEVKELNADLLEVQRLDTLISTLREYHGPTICHEWPFPVALEGRIERADLAQILNANTSMRANRRNATGAKQRPTANVRT